MGGESRFACRARTHDDDPLHVTTVVTEWIDRRLSAPAHPWPALLTTSTPHTQGQRR
jgi:hypothetical protein